jgi:divalent metal cation (Fe/Co/Zn/Cd) transporter
MGDLVDKVQSLKKKKLILWGLRQLISACILIPVVLKWPHWKWLIPVWLILAAMSLVATFVLLRRFQDQMSSLESKLAKADADHHDAS